MRLFIAINLPAEWKELLTQPQESIAWLGKGVRWAEPTGMHLTLKFLGDVERDTAEKIGASLQTVARTCHPFSMRMAGTGVFPNPRRPRVFWAGITAPNELHDLQRNVEDEMELLGFPKEERDFHPHLTVARIKDPIGKKRITDAFLSFKMRSELFQVDHMSLMRSHLSSEGARYEELQVFNFSTAPELNL